MKVFLLVFVLTSLIIGYKYVRFLFKRLILYIKFKKKNIRVIRNHLLWFLGTKQQKSCDFYIETKNEILAVKLFDILSHSSTLVLTDNSYYYIRKYAIFISMSPHSLRKPIDGPNKVLPEYDFRCGFPDEWKTKATQNVLLISPVCREIIMKPEHGNEVFLGQGDKVNDMIVMSLSSLIKYIEQKK